MRRVAIVSILTGALLCLSVSVFAQTSPRQANTGMTVEEYEEIIMGLPLFSGVIENWSRKSVAGDIAKTYKPMRVLKTYPKGKQVIFPKKGDMIIYQLTGFS
jgi:hypothetical protein